jgi:hypothetical protein
VRPALSLQLSAISKSVDRIRGVQRAGTSRHGKGGERQEKAVGSSRKDAGACTHRAGPSWAKQRGDSLGGERSL